MHPIATDKRKAWIQKLEAEKASFDSGNLFLSEKQSKWFKEYLNILGSTAEFYPKKTRLCKMLRLILSKLGHEVFLLCTVASPPSKLMLVPQTGLLDALKKWWDHTSKPKGWRDFATKTCKSTIVEVIMSATRRDEPIDRILPPSHEVPIEEDTGELYELEVTDAVQAIASGQIVGKILLTIPMYQDPYPFITASFTQQFVKQFATKRRRIM